MIERSLNMDQAVVDLVIKVISTLGFPIFVAVWLLIRTDNLIKTLTVAVESLKDEIGKLHT